MVYEIIAHKSHCSLEVFKINGIDADYDDFGELVDKDPSNAPMYGCGNRQFRAYHKIGPDVLARYNIAWDEASTIGDILEDALSFGQCAMCA